MNLRPKGVLNLIEIRGQQNICSICSKSRGRIDGHHLSYNPEVVIYLCHQCHIVLHVLARLNLNALDILVSYSKDYMKSGVNGTEEYRKSEYRKFVDGESRKKRREENIDLCRKQGREEQKRFRLKFKMENPEEYKKLTHEQSRLYLSKVKEDPMRHEEFKKRRREAVKKCRLKRKKSLKEV